VQYHLKMLGNLREHLPVAGQYSLCEMPLPEQHSISDAVSAVNLPSNRPYFVILNGDKLHPESYAHTILQENDELVLFPPIKGG
jgi:sulfur carrier protein ThiS